MIYSELHQAFILKSRIASQFTWGFILSLDGSKTCSLYKWWSFTTPQISTLFSRELEAPTDFYQSVPILLSRALHRREQGLLNAGTRFHEDVSCLPEVYFKGIRQYSVRPFLGVNKLLFLSASSQQVLGLIDKWAPHKDCDVSLFSSNKAQRGWLGSLRVTWIWFIINFQFVFPDHWPLLWSWILEASVFRMWEDGIFSLLYY